MPVWDSLTPEPQLCNSTHDLDMIKLWLIILTSLSYEEEPALPYFFVYLPIILHRAGFGAS